MKVKIWFYILVTYVIVTCCQQSNNKIESRNLYVFDLDSLKRIETYKLQIVSSDSLIKYQYFNLNNKEKNIDLTYNLNSRILSFADTNFERDTELSYSNSNLSKNKFSLFKSLDSIVDGNGPILFNEEYGVLNIDNGWGLQLIFMNTNNENLAVGILEKLNKINSPPQEK